MEEQILDASSAEFDDFDLTGEYDELEPHQNEDPQNSEETNEEQDENSNEPTSEISEQQEEQEEQENQEESQTNQQDDFTLQILKLKGIQDPSKIKFEDESGAVIERDWNDLTTNEKLSIITLEEDADTDLEEDEIEFINMLRSNNLTPKEYINLLQNSIAQRIQDSQQPVYEIDNLSDDELFALDLIEKLGEENVTDEELQEALQSAKANEDLYKKQVSALRTYYQNLENQKNYEQEQQHLQQLEQDYSNFSNQILNQIEGFNSIAGQEIELSVDDKNDIANYILTRDENGQSDFYKQLQNPQTLTTAAFWLVKGPEVLQEMENQIKAAYQRGYTLGSSKHTNLPKVEPKKDKAEVVITPKSPAKKNPNYSNDASAAFGDDESYLYN